MFEGIVINLSEPICGCKKQNLIFSTSNNTLYIQCHDCSTLITIPPGQLKGTISLGKPYPEDRGPEANLDLFKRITIELTGPICECPEENLSWSVGPGKLLISCKTCGVKLLVPREKFLARFSLDKSYIGKTPSLDKFFKDLEDQMKDIEP